MKLLIAPNHDLLTLQPSHCTVYFTDIFLILPCSVAYLYWNLILSFVSNIIYQFQLSSSLYFPFKDKCSAVEQLQCLHLLNDMYGLMLHHSPENCHRNINLYSKFSFNPEKSYNLAKYRLINVVITKNESYVLHPFHWSYWKTDSLTRFCLAHCLQVCDSEPGGVGPISALLFLAHQQLLVRAKPKCRVRHVEGLSLSA